VGEDGFKSRRIEDPSGDCAPVGYIGDEIPRS